MSLRAGISQYLNGRSSYDTLFHVSEARAGRRSVLSLSSVALMVAFCLPVAGWLVPGESLLATAARETIYWIMTGVLIAYVLLVERRALSSIGLIRPSIRSVVFGVIAAVCAFSGMALIYVFVLPKLAPSYAHQTAAVIALPMALRIEIVVRAAVFEELFYRGFMIEHLTPLLRSRSAAALVSLAAFTLAHVSYWGLGSLMIAGFGGVVLTALYLWRRDLSANVVAHALTDAAAFLG